MIPDDLLARARAWAEDDPDEGTRAELLDLVAREDVEELAQRFAGPLRFGRPGCGDRWGPGRHG